MRTIKLRLLALMPTVCAFLDKDDLKHGAGAEYIDKSSIVLCYCTAKYLNSRACAREIFRAVLQGKPMFVVLESDTVARGEPSLKCIADAALPMTETFDSRPGRWADASSNQGAAADASVPTILPAQSIRRSDVGRALGA